LDFAGTGHSPPMPETRKQSDKNDDQFFRLAVNSAASRANGHLKLLARYPTLRLTSSRDALNQPVVAANYVSIVVIAENRKQSVDANNA